MTLFLLLLLKYTFKGAYFPFYQKKKRYQRLWDSVKKHGKGNYRKLDRRVRSLGINKE